jgi:DNA-binding NarL/FixJ family response regulator
MPERYGNRALNNTEERVVELVARWLKNNEVAEVMGTARYVIANYLRAITTSLGSGMRRTCPMVRIAGVPPANDELKNHG